MRGLKEICYTILYTDEKYLITKHSVSKALIANIIMDDSAAFSFQTKFAFIEFRLALGVKVSMNACFSVLAFQ